MKKLVLAFGVLLIAGASWAHLPVGTTFLAVQFPDANVPTIDGNLTEWDVIPEVYWIDHTQLTETVIGVGTAWDATDLSLRAIVGYNATINRLLIMEDRFDDQILVRTGWEPMEMVFDADHTGGMFNVWGDIEDQETKERLHGAQAQNYGFNQGGPGLNAWHKAQWHYSPPWGEIASTQTVDDNSGEGFFRAEYMLTGWDDLDWASAETSTIHTLVEGDVVGFHFTIIDDDDLDVGGYEGYWTLSGATDSYFQGDLLSDFLLAPIDPDIDWGGQMTAVSSESWGRIKSTFAE
jgi:hypothetical protein